MPKEKNKKRIKILEQQLEELQRKFNEQRVELRKYVDENTKTTIALDTTFKVLKESLLKNIV